MIKRRFDSRSIAVHVDPALAETLYLNQYSALTLFFPTPFVSTKLTIYRQDPQTLNWVSIGRTIPKPTTLPGYADLPKEEFTAGPLRLVCDNAVNNGQKLGYCAKA